MKKTERKVFWHDVYTQPKSRSLKSPKTLEIKTAFEIIKKLNKEDMFVESKDKQEYYYVSDWQEVGNHIIALLINKSDKTVANPIFSDTATRNRREVEKKDTEGQDYSSHILIKFDENNKSEAILLLEYCPGLGGSITLKHIFTQLIKKAEKLSPEKFEQSHPDGSIEENGQPKKCKVTYSFVLDKHPSDDFIKDLEEGELKGFDIIERENISPGFDEDSYFKEDRLTLSVKVRKDVNWTKQKIRAIKDYIKNHKHDGKSTKIRFKSPDGLDKVVDLDTDNENSSLYVKKSIISDFDSELKSSYDAINHEMINKMATLLEN